MFAQLKSRSVFIFQPNIACERFELSLVVCVVFRGLICFFVISLFYTALSVYKNLAYLIAYKYYVNNLSTLNILNYETKIGFTSKNNHSIEALADGKKIIIETVVSNFGNGYDP